MLEYVITNAVWSLGGFILGWVGCSRWQRLERKVDHIDQIVGKRDHDDK